MQKNHDDGLGYYVTKEIIGGRKLLAGKKRYYAIKPNNALVEKYVLDKVNKGFYIVFLY